MSHRPPQDGPAGNIYDKYETGNPIARWLVERFGSELEHLLSRADPRTILDVGCGEGVLTERFAARPSVSRVLGVDLEAPALQAQWAARRQPGLDFRVIEPGDLPFASGEFELVSALEVLEHVRDPVQLVEEMRRCASRWVLASVPREPLWRVLNLLRGAYWRGLGNTPGHVNHWSQSGFIELMATAGRPEEVRSPTPWTMVLVRV